MRRVPAWLAWFAGLFLLWLLLVGNLAGTERIAGLFAAAIGATAAEIVRSLGLFEFRVERRWLARTPKQLASAFFGFFVVLRTLARPRSGTFRTAEFPTGGERAVDHGRRAWAAFAGSLGPNTLVVDLDPNSGLALLHDLVSQAAADEVL